MMGIVHQQLITQGFHSQHHLAREPAATENDDVITQSSLILPFFFGDSDVLTYLTDHWQTASPS
jgi:hypothetical protein